MGCLQRIVTVNNFLRVRLPPRPVRLNIDSSCNHLSLIEIPQAKVYKHLFRKPVHHESPRINQHGGILRIERCRQHIKIYFFIIVSHIKNRPPSYFSVTAFSVVDIITLSDKEFNRELSKNHNKLTIGKKREL